MASSATHLHDHDSGEGLLSVDDAREKVLSQVQPLSTINLPLTESHGCVLAEEAVASSNIPDFPSSAMDGFAVRSSDVAGASPGSPVELAIVGRAPIGRRPEATVG
ncbi:MAG: gephyrin-like molybdotransferase Glp, partial [Actinomycetota bacterium]